MRRLLAHRDARLFLVGQSFSLLGDTALWLGYARGDLARALWHASRPLDRPDEDT